MQYLQQVGHSFVESMSACYHLLRQWNHGGAEMLSEALGLLEFGVDRLDCFVSIEGLFPLLLDLPRLFPTCLQLSFFDVPFMDEDVEPFDLTEHPWTRAQRGPFHFVLVEINSPRRFGIIPVERQLWQTNFVRC